jgi:hypothetical protein
MCGQISLEISNVEIHEHPSGGDKFFRTRGGGIVKKMRHAGRSCLSKLLKTILTSVRT